MQKKLTIKILLFACLFVLQAAAQHPEAVMKNLQIAGSNRTELEKAITYCENTKDPLKLQAMYFLIANMDIHGTANYYWESKDGQKIGFNELDYPDFDKASEAFEAIKTQFPELKPKPFYNKDLEHITANFLIDNLEKAFQSWKDTPLNKVSFEDFCNYILPYRITVEPLQEWRNTYASKYDWLKKEIKINGLTANLPFAKKDANSWFTNTWKTGGGRKEPLPRLGSMQILLRKQGLCEDLANLGVFSFRALGIPATVNNIPFWATATGGHTTNTVFETNGLPVAFDYNLKTYYQNLQREPAKVLRTTYSKQSNTLASLVPQDSIPHGYLRTSNYIDVTQDYWETTSVNAHLYPTTANHQTVYIATFNGLKWQPFWWGAIKNNQSQWDKICVGTVILPQYYQNEKMVPAADPIVVSATENKVLTPNFKELIEVNISSFPSYLLIKPAVTYKLFYWNKTWQLVAAQKATETTKTLTYQGVPKNALLLLVASDSKGYERPFIINNHGERQWF